jgi:hypothetical protein
MGEGGVPGVFMGEGWQGRQVGKAAGPWERQAPAWHGQQPVSGAALPVDHLQKWAPPVSAKLLPGGRSPHPPPPFSHAGRRGPRDAVACLGAPGASLAGAESRRRCGARAYRVAPAHVRPQ